MIGDEMKIVYFGEYCPKCKYYLRSERDEPCNECLSNPTNTWSHKPVKFKEKEK